MNIGRRKLKIALAPLSVVIAPLALLAACAPDAGQAPPPLANARIGGPLPLIDQNGRRFDDAALRGRYRIVYFGYTYCPDVCPVDMQRIAQGLRALEASDPALARQVTPIFITVDPTRDTPLVLKQFVGAFHPRMIGLTGSPAEIAAVAKAYGIFYQPHAKGADGGYTVDHSRAAYLFGKKGEPLALLRHDGTPEQIAADIRQWAR